MRLNTSIIRYVGCENVQSRLYDAVENVKKHLTFCTHLLVEIARLVHVVLLHELDYLVIASVIGPAYTHTQIHKLRFSQIYCCFVLHLISALLFGHSSCCRTSVSVRVHTLVCVRTPKCMYTHECMCVYTQIHTYQYTLLLYFGAMGSLIKKRCTIKETTNCCNSYTYQLVLVAVSIKPEIKHTHQVCVEMSCIHRKVLAAGGREREIERETDRPRER